MSTAAWRGWSRLKIWSKRLWGRFARSTKKIVGESEQSFVVPGNMDVDRLDELLGVSRKVKSRRRLPDLVSELAGRIPKKGEVVEEDGSEV